MDLPIEIRSIIYRFAVTIPDGILCKKDEVLRLPALTFVSKEIRQEALKAFFRFNEFVFDSFALSSVEHWLSSKVVNAHLQFIQAITFRLSLEGTQQLRHIALIGWTPLLARIPLSSFEFYSVRFEGQINLQEEQMKAAFALGREAHEKGTKKGALYQEAGLWCARLPRV